MGEFVNVMAENVPNLTLVKFIEVKIGLTEQILELAI